ncbi:MAG: glnD [Ilumatobacteraceae bacterium]|nr:glnD [Ilumatobacteraceae bacterium]
MITTIDGAFVKRARAEMVARTDLAGRGLARRLSDQMDGWFDALAAHLPDGWALIATGGYAAGLLTPGSDIDVILLHPQKARAKDVTAVAEPIWYPMWDAGMKLSPAAHSVKSLLALASSDLVTATAILRVRRLAGQDDLVTELRAAALDQWRKRPTHWLSELHRISADRWSKYGEVASLLEPDLKDGQGGLRDYDTIRWALAVDRPEISASLEAPFEDLAAPAEQLLATRCELHRLTGKSTNVLLLQDQDAVAEAMGFADADVLMARVSSAARAIDWASERFWWRVERASRKGKGAISTGKVQATLAEGVTVVDDEVEVDVAQAGVDQSLVLRVAAAAAHAGYPISRRTLIQLAATAVDDSATWDERTRNAMVSLLGAGPQLVAAVEALERYDLFSNMLPEWRHVRSLPQRNAFHTYTVDRHLLQTVANAGDLLRQVARPDLLLIGALLHDIGKGYPGDHTAVGVELVERIVPRMGFAADDVDIVRSLVQNHLLLSETAMRRDLADPRTAENVAELIGDPPRLELLRALTEADSLATGPSAWSRWKASLLDELTRNVAAVFAGRVRGSGEVALDDRFGDLVDEVRSTGVLHTHHETADQFDLWVVATPDQRGLFAKIAGTLAVHGIDVVSAQAWTSADGIAVDQFRVSRSGSVATDWKRLETDLRGSVGGTVDVGSRIAQRVRTYSRTHRRAFAAAPPRLEVLISNNASASTTMIDVRAPDAIAVLYRLASAIAGRGLDIRSAKVATLGHEVIDVFYVQRSGRTGAARQVPERDHAVLREELKLALTS